MVYKYIFLLSIFCFTNIIYGQTYENYTFKLDQSSSFSGDIWTTTPAQKILKNADIPEHIDDTIKVYCAKNEFEPFVFVIKPSSDSELSIDISSFGSNIETEINIVKYVNLTQATDALGHTGDFPDPLWPINTPNSVQLTANENTAFWVTVYVPSTVSGSTNYYADITIGSTTIPVCLHVFDFEIPEEIHTKSQMNFSHNTIISKYGVTGTGSDYWMYVDMIKQYFIDHRLTPKSALWSGGLTSSGGAPYIDYNCNGEWTDNDGIWGFEEPAQRYLNGTGLMNGTYSSVFNEGTGFPSFMCATFQNNDPSQDQRPSDFCGIPRDGTWSEASSAYNTKWFEYISSMETYLDDLNYLDKAYYYFANEPQDQADYDAIAWYSQELKSAAPNLKLMVSEEPKPEIFDHPSYSGTKIDIWLPVLHQYNPEVSWDRELNHNEETWMYFLHGTTPPYFNPITIDHEGVESKLTAWFMWKYRIRGIAYYSFNNWSSNPWTNPMDYGQNGNKSIIYPPAEDNNPISFGSNNHRFVPSIRFELLRDGLEDYEYLYVLAGNKPQVNIQNSADIQADKIIGGLTSYARDANFMYNLRRLIGLKNGGEISSIPDIQPPSTHWRAQGEPGNYYINFQNPLNEPQTSYTNTVEGIDYRFYTFDNKDYLQIGSNDYDENKGYGWYAPDDVNWETTYDQWFTNGNELQKSQLYSDWGRAATFEFALPSGQYNISVSIGHRSTYNHQFVTIEGVEFFNDAATSNSCAVTTLPVSINDNMLSMEIGNGSDYTMLNYIDIEVDENYNNNQSYLNNTNDLQISAYPNPSKDIVNFKYYISGNTNVKLAIYNIYGQEIETLINQNQNKAEYKLTYNTQELSPGIYIYTLETDKSIISKKLIIK
jgi:hypothetical protein